MSTHIVRKVAKTLAVVTAGASSSEAAIVVFDINPDVLTRSASALGANDSSTFHIDNINLGAGTFTSYVINNNVSASDYASYSTQFTFGSTVYQGTAQQIVGGGGASFNILLNNLSQVATFAEGQSFGPDSTIWGAWRNSNSVFPQGKSYYGLRIGDGSGFNYNYGWLEVTHGPLGDLYTRFAFSDVLNQSILAGYAGTPVPEASTLGFAGGLFGLVAAAHLRRRKLKQAAASDKFLALAAGEKLS